MNKDLTFLDGRIPAILGFPKIRGTFLGIPIIRTIVFWGLYWGTLILGNCHILDIVSKGSNLKNI